MGADHLLRGAAVGGLIGFVACGPRGTFACDDDSACVFDSQVGRCEDDGYCSFPDGGCPSGFRYGQHAATTVAGTCVDQGDTAGGSTSGTTTAGSANSITGPGSTTGQNGTVGVDATTASTGGATTLSTTGTGATSHASAGTSGTTGTASTSGGPSVCVDDPFDDGVIATFGCEFDAPGITLLESGGQFQCTMDSSGASAYAGFDTCNDVDLTGLVAHIELVVAPTAAIDTIALLEIRNDEVGFGIAVETGTIYAYNFSGNVYMNYGDIDYDATAHRWLQARDLGNENVRLEAGPDGTQWTEIATVSDFGAIASGHISVTCGYEPPPSSQVTVVWDNFEYCLP